MSVGRPFRRFRGLRGIGLQRPQRHAARVRIQPDGAGRGARAITEGEHREQLGESLGGHVGFAARHAGQTRHHQRRDDRQQRRHHDQFDQGEASAHAMEARFSGLR
jgi:hypothetical protein